MFHGKKKSARLRPKARSLPEAIREFLTPEVFKQVRKAASRRKMPRWDVHALIYVLLIMTWCCGDSLPEKFEAAKNAYAKCCPKRRRPGKTFEGFEKAMIKLPMALLRTLACSLRSRIEALFGDRLFSFGFIPLGCDGTRQECPRTEELERRLKTGSKEDSAPTIWNTSVVHLTLGIPWCWLFGPGGKSSERAHLVQMLPLLPAAALLVTDAGYVGYEVLRRLVAAKTWFLLRMSSNATFYTDGDVPLEDFREGIVYYWPKCIQKEGLPPIRGRLIRVCSLRKKTDVWLFTNVEDPQRLSLDAASRFYRWRWENEGFFRTYKRTLGKLKMHSRTVRSVHREAEASMIATQLLLCQGALAMRPVSQDATPVTCSPRKVLVEIRREFNSPRFRNDFVVRLAKAQRERRSRETPKEKRVWPRRKPYKPPSPPLLLKLTEELKSKIANTLCAA
jgi:hypothetical protein